MCFEYSKIGIKTLPLFGGSHHAVAVWRKDADWKKLSSVLDPWFTCASLILSPYPSAGVYGIISWGNFFGTFIWEPYKE